MTHPVEARRRWRNGLAAASTFTLVCLLAISVVACGGGDKSVAPEEPAQVRLLMGEAGGNPPAGTSLVVPGGGLVNNGFPSLSADGSKIAVLYLTGSPTIENYPVLDIYSTASLKVLERVELFPEHAQFLVQGPTPDLGDARLVARIEATVKEIDERLRRDGFRAIPQWYDAETNRSFQPIEKFGKRLSFVWREEGNDQTPAVEIESLDSGRLEYRLVMPTIPVSVNRENPDNDCTVGGGIVQMWYESQQRILIARMELAGSWDGCYLPDRWILARL